MTIYNTLLIGPPTIMVQNTIYSMPARSVMCVSSQVCEFANTTTTTDFIRITTSTTGFQSAFNYVRNTNTTVATIMVKAL